MQVIHSVKHTDDEIDALLQLGKRIGEVTESSAYGEEEREEIISKACKLFVETLNAYAHEAFTYGYNEGLNNANVKDTAMYKPSKY